MNLRLRRGFTLVELLVAVLLIDVGLLALVAGSAVVVKRHNELRIRTTAARAAANRIQLLSASCTGASGTATVDRGITESWSTAIGANGIRDLSDSVAFTLSGVEHQVVLRSRMPC